LDGGKAEIRFEILWRGPNGCLICGRLCREGAGPKEKCIPGAISEKKLALSLSQPVSCLHEESGIFGRSVLQKHVDDLLLA
jgi:hypothetical protein